MGLKMKILDKAVLIRAGVVAFALLVLVGGAITVGGGVFNFNLTWNGKDCPEKICPVCKDCPKPKPCPICEECKGGLGDPPTGWDWFLLPVPVPAEK